MDRDAFKAAIAQFGYSQEGLAEALGYSGRAGQRWAAGEAKVPGAVAVVLRLLQARPELVHVLAEVAPMSKAKRKSPAGRRSR